MTGGSGRSNCAGMPVPNLNG